MDQMKWIGTLTIQDGNISKIFLKSDLTVLSAANSRTTEVVISGTEENDRLSELSITSNLLTSVPKNLAKLKSLSILILDGNMIEYANFSEFNGLSNLKKLSLSNNRLYILMDNQDVKLHRLKSLDLSRNYLTELDMINWEMPLLQTLNIRDNHLTFLMNFDLDNFPSLISFDLYGNLWDCRWRDSFAPVLDTINIKSQGYRAQTSIECTKMTQLSEAAYRKLNITTIKKFQFTLNNVEQLETQIGSLVMDVTTHATNIEALKELLNSQQKTISELLEKTLDQQKSIEEMLGKIQELELNAERSYSPFVGVVPKGLAAKLISEISDVIRKHLPSDDGTNTGSVN
ncbi:leucine-rich repeat-containing protein 15-like isoform X2 [Topomyia yanbarensis]|nr:leucine-rich repeat-containing protein 15-like isoform X2 [Topomyia yanbarensis]